MTRPEISILHATYHRQLGPEEVIKSWLSRASGTVSLEYLLAHDHDDAKAKSAAKDLNVVSITGPPNPVWSTAVRNWNAAAQASTGSLLLVVADDLFPPEGWDLTLLEIISGLDPLEISFAVKVQDGRKPDDCHTKVAQVRQAALVRGGSDAL